jgi:hypothetical protein
MTFRPTYTDSQFTKISIDKFIEKFKADNPKEDTITLRKSLLHFKKLKAEGATCDCGNSIWIIGSAFSGRTCFTCLAGVSHCSDDYEIK